MPLPSGLKIEPAKVILFLILKRTAFVVFYSPPLEGAPPNVINLNNNPYDFVIPTKEESQQT